jgi:hypothetical protein
MLVVLQRFQLLPSTWLFPAFVKAAIDFMATVLSLMASFTGGGNSHGFCEETSGWEVASAFFEISSGPLARAENTFTTRHFSRLGWRSQTRHQQFD